MSKITDYPAATSFDTGDILIKDGTGGTKKIPFNDAAIAMAGSISAIMHRNIYRGKNLGSTITPAQKAAIQNGTFEDMYIGDYWLINSRYYEIADINYWLNTGDVSFGRQHLVIVPRYGLTSAAMNSTNTTVAGYTGSEMYTTHMASVKATIQEVFGDMLLSHRELLVNAISNGLPSGQVWADSDVELMNEIMVHGSHIFAPANDGANIPFSYTVDKTQLALFRLCPWEISTRESYWLRDVVSAALFASVNGYGYPGCTGASIPYSIRPAFPIG